MWIFTEVGFFSIVGSKDPDKLMVRSRDPKDLDLLRKIYLPELTPTVMTPTRDYPARGFATHEQVAMAMARIAASIDYTNFKDHVHDLDPDRVKYYSRVWSVMCDSMPAGVGGRWGLDSNKSSGQTSMSFGPHSAEESAQVFLGTAAGNQNAAEREAVSAGSGMDEPDLKTEEEIKKFLSDFYGEDFDPNMDPDPDGDLKAAEPRLLGPGEESSYETLYDDDEDESLVGTYMR